MIRRKIVIAVAASGVAATSLAPLSAGAVSEIPMASAGLAAHNAVGQGSRVRRTGDVADPDSQTVLWMLKTKSDEVRRALDTQLADSMRGLRPRFVSARGIAKRFGASQADVALVGAYLRDRGYRPVLDATHSFFQSQMTTAQIETELLTTMGKYHMDVDGAQPVEFRAPDRAPTIPSRLRDAVTGFAGLRILVTAGRYRPPAPARSATATPPNVRTGTPQGCKAAVAGGFFTPNQLLTAYGIDRLHAAGFKGEGMRVAVITPPADPKSFTGFTACFPQLYGRPARINSRVAYHAGAAGSASGEGDMDLQAISMSVPHADRIDFFAALQPYQQTLALSQMIDPRSYPDSRIPHIVSFSMAGGVEGLNCPTGFGDGYSDLTRDYLVEAVHRAALAGVTLVFASGDSGGYGAQTCPSPAISVPGDSPYVTSVGGTDLWLNTNNTIRTSRPWNTASLGGYGAGGGGDSVTLTSPYGPAFPPARPTARDWPNFQTELRLGLGS